jgi:DNA ligase 1
MKLFARLFAELDRSTGTLAKVDALKRYFALAAPRDAAWAVYFLAGGKPRQVVPNAVLWATACRQAGIDDWLFDACYQAVGDFAETVTHVLPPPARASELGLAEWVEERLLTLRGLAPAEQAERLASYWDELDASERFLLNKLIGGEFRVGVSKLLVQRALAEGAGIDAKRVAQRMMGYTDKRATPTAERYAQLTATGDTGPLELGQPYPFFLAHPLEFAEAELAARLGAPADWIVEWKYDGIRAQLLKRGDNWRLWSRGEELISDAYPDLVPLARALPSGTSIDGELVVLIPPEHEFAIDSLEGLAIFASLQQRLGRKIVSEKTKRELPVAFIAYDLIESEGRDLRAEPQHVRRTLLERLVVRLFVEAKMRGERLPIRISPTVSADTWEELAEKREQARALLREGLMLKARDGAYGIGRRKGDDRTNVWWKWKLDPMSVDAVVIYAERGHGRRSGVYTDYTFAVWNAGEEASARELVPFAKAYSGLSDKEIREMDAIVRRTTLETYGPVRSLTPTQVFELGFEGIAPSKRHRSGVAVRFPRMLRWRRDKPIAEADTLDVLKALLAGQGG